MSRSKNTGDEALLQRLIRLYEEAVATHKYRLAESLHVAIQTQVFGHPQGERSRHATLTRT